MTLVASPDYQARPLRVGIGGPVGSGKTALVEALCKRLRDDYDDSGWSLVSVPGTFSPPPSSHVEGGWYRLRFAVPAAWTVPVGRGVACNFGKVSSWPTFSRVASAMPFRRSTSATHWAC